MNIKIVGITTRRNISSRFCPTNKNFNLIFKLIPAIKLPISYEDASNINGILVIGGRILNAWTRGFIWLQKGVF